MDNFEKQQTIEAIKVSIKARWIYASIIFVQGIIIKYFFTSVPLADTPILSFILASAFLFNIGYWLYIRRPPEKISNFGVHLVKALQVAMDSIWISAILFFSGTVGKMIITGYFIAIMNGASLYKKKGMVLSTLFLQFLFTVLAVLQYSGKINANPPVKEVFSFPFAKGDKHGLLFLLVAFYAYSSGGAVFGGYLAGLFKKREIKLVAQRNELSEKTQTLVHQAQELNKTKDYLHEALTKSDKARNELEATKKNLEKTNLELKNKLDELEKYGQVTTGRELKMIELKEKIRLLEQRIGELDKN
ncbi:MAG: hypothetical protein A2Y98_01495 [Candidatus Portnoybacteria bacterium RBG_19FT_COMBO_36_7]|uniref:Uncharacterized protein n=1 Tax=Candidatus Portnoybacteria bacterium RBG_19FT_COMBO_36_7 TaxID=1801992 RepID=A0A1G2F6C0_9BACT|nr:MAG: hypothetical protein A2Y98_01495 [Candidatus Portnoybacteria bacterium RBG_19FT_COMBO_36_7]